MKNITKFSASALVAISLILQGCGADDKEDAVETQPQSFSIEVTNLTNKQAFSPMAVILHGDGYHAYMLGERAGLALETLAEGGDNSALLEEADSNSNVMHSVSGVGSIAPGMSEVITIENMEPGFKLSLVSMLVNTNDGFTGRDAMSINALELNESQAFMTRVYDSGTELNDEAAASLPGQGGEGFNALRDDRDFVAVHAGIVSSEDGLATSAVDSSYRFDNPAARVVVTRIE